MTHGVTSLLAILPFEPVGAVTRVCRSVRVTGASIQTGIKRDAWSLINFAMHALKPALANAREIRAFIDATRAVIAWVKRDAGSTVRLAVFANESG